MANPTPANTPLPDVPLGADIETTAWMQEVGANLNQILLDKGPPSIVTGLTATANSATIVLRWNAAHNASLYNVYRNTTGDFASASVVRTVGASKTGVASLSTQDSQDQTQAQRFYWVQAVNERGLTGPQSQMVIVTNFTAATGSTALGDNARASGADSTALGTNAAATATDTTALGINATASAVDSTALGKSTIASGTDSTALGSGSVASATNATALGKSTTASGADSTALGSSTTASATSSIAIGQNVSVDSSSPNSVIVGSGGAVQTSIRSVVVGNLAQTNTSDESIAIGYASGAGPGASNGMAIGDHAQVGGGYGIALGSGASAVTHQFAKGSDTGYLSDETTTMASGGGRFVVKCLFEKTPIAAAAFTDTTIQIPTQCVVYGVTAGVSTAIPTATTFDLGIAGSTTRYGTAISATIGSGHIGVEPGPLYYGTATKIRISPNTPPLTTGGFVTVCIFYYTLGVAFIP